MLTNERLTKAYQHALLIPFSTCDSFVFFSDLHRGDDSISDEFVRNQTLVLHALNYYFEEGFTYVEAGDGDELWEYIDFKTIRYAHADVFSLLKKFYQAKRFYLLYGNHNISLKNKAYVKRAYASFYDDNKQKRISLFPSLMVHEALVLKARDSGKELFVVHGHQGDFMNDQLWFVTKLLLRYFWRYLHVVGFHNPASPAKNLFTRHKVEKAYKKWIRTHKKILLCGHTHRQHYPKPGELPYFNTGCCIRSKSISCIELKNNELALIDWRIHPDKDGTLKVTRSVVCGPKNIDSF